MSETWFETYPSLCFSKPFIPEQSFKPKAITVQALLENILNYFFWVHHVCLNYKQWKIPTTINSQLISFYIINESSH